MLALCFDVRMLLAHEPSTVGKEEASFGIMGISICLRVLVMYTVVTCPINNVILSKQITKCDLHIKAMPGWCIKFALLK